jgi:hypothetical protein
MKENIPAMSASLVFQISYYSSIVCCQNQRFEMESCSVVEETTTLRPNFPLDQRDCVSLNPSTDLEPRREAIVLSQVGADFPIDELCISKSLLLNLPGKEEGPKPGNFPALLLEEPAGEAKLS